MGKDAATNQQSRKSIHQFCERMVEIGWTANELAYDDTCEGVVVKIFDRSVTDSAQSIPRGLSFFAQIKRMADRGVQAGALMLPRTLVDRARRRNDGLVHARRDAHLRRCV